MSSARCSQGSDTRPQPHQINHCSLPAGLERTPGVMHREMGLSQRSHHSDGGHKQGSGSPEKLDPSTVQLTESIPHTSIWPSTIGKLGPRQLTGRSTAGCSKVKLKMLHLEIIKQPRTPPTPQTCFCTACAEVTLAPGAG